MTKAQMQAARGLSTALAKCGRYGLRGGVYSGSFCIWPKSKPHPEEIVMASSGGVRFFGAVEGDSGGMILGSGTMYLDGGAGV